VTDGIDSVSLKFNNFTGAFKLAADADGDTLIFDPPASGSLESAPRAKDASHDGPDAIHSGDAVYVGFNASQMAELHANWAI
jgi:hypothetical protein